mgnify:CR=1 FL=1
MAQHGMGNEISSDRDSSRIRNNPRDMQVRADLVRTIYQHIPRSSLGVLAGALTVAWSVWGRIDSYIVFSWLGAIGAIMVWRFTIYRAFPASGPTHEQVAHWERLWTISTGIHGSIWGSSAFLLYVPDSPEHQAVLLVALFAISTAAVPLVVRHLPSLYAFVLTVLAPIIVRLAHEGTDTQIALVVISGLVMYGIFIFGTELNRTITESVRRYYENIDLIAQLTDQTQKAEAARQEADEANRMKTRFLAAASHDLRQPMHALGLFSDSLRRRLSEPDDRALADRICRSAEAVEETFNALMDVSRLDAGIVEANLQPCSLQSIMERVAQDCAAEAHAKGIALRCRPTTMGAVSDPVLLERILRNLAANAVRYTSRGGVLIACRPQGRSVSVEVWDTGIGIADDKHGRIFDEFYQAGARDRREGLGLGLAIVRRLTQILDARVSMRSTPGVGSVFKLLLPNRTDAPACVQPEPSTQSPQRLSAVANTVVLLIDDDPQVLEAMTEAMLGWGIRSVAARSLIQALERLPECEQYPDAIVSDFHLGDDENGIDAVRRIRHELGVDVPAMIVTGDTAPQSLRLIRESGLPCLAKPVTADRLLQALGTLIASK